MALDRGKILLGFDAYTTAVQLLTEAFLFVVTEILVRLLFPKNQNGGIQSRNYRIYLLTTQGVLLSIISILMSVFDRIPYVLSLVTCFVFLKLAVLLLSQGSSGTDNSFVSRPLPVGGKTAASKHEQMSNTGFLYPGREMLKETPNYQRNAFNSQNTTLENKQLELRSTIAQSNLMTTRIARHPASPTPPPPLQRPALSSTSTHKGFTARISESLFSKHPSLGYFSSVLDFRKPSNSPPGLLNSGNTCFINSTLQCLVWTPGFIDVIPIVTSFYNNQSTFFKDLNDVVYQCHASPDSGSVYDPVDAKQLLRSISMIAPHLISDAGGHQSQQDAAEFLLWFLDHLHTSLRDLTGGRSGLEAVFTEANLATLLTSKQACLVKLEKLRSAEILLLKEPLINLSEVDLQLHWQKHSSTLHKMFLGQLIEARECQMCLKMSVSVEYFTLLPLPLPPRTKDNLSLFSLQDCFSLFGKIEDLVQSNMITCSCISAEEDTLTPGKRLAMLTHLPPRLILQLTRYSYSSTLNSAIKNKSHISLPMCLDLSPYTMRSKLSPGVSTPPLVYELQALILHSGSQSTSFGHYVAYCKVVNERWYYFNDDVVTPVSDFDAELRKSFILENAYLLFYTKKD